MREWMLDNRLTPHVVVDAAAAGVEVPADFVNDGRIVLNLSDAATDALVLGNDVIEFSARFAGTPRAVRFPVDAVLGIYARETAQGMVFGAETVAPAGASDGQAGNGDDADPSDDDPPDGSGGEGRRGSHLKVVK